MNWITNYVRPTINSLFSRREMPENLWVKCPDCGTMLFHRELSDNLQVCTGCGHHMPISPRARFAQLFDNGLYAEVPVPEPLADPLQFRDQKKYPERMRAAQKSTGEREAMLVVEGEICRTPIVAAAQDFAFMGGSMGMHVGNALIAACARATELRRPLVVFTAAGGARMQEGILSLMQMPRSTVAVQMLKEAGLPYVVVLTHPTTGGVTASYAMLGDVQIAEPGALICFAGPRVIEQTIREKLPEGFQRAEYLLDHGMLDRVTPRKALREELVLILRMLTGQTPPVWGDLPAPTADAPPAPDTALQDAAAPGPAEGAAAPGAPKDALGSGSTGDARPPEAGAPAHDLAPGRSPDPAQDRAPDRTPDHTSAPPAADGPPGPQAAGPAGHGAHPAEATSADPARTDADSAPETSGTAPHPRGARRS